MHVSALHLPQFHRTPENDLWWGKGFTEWTNVARARPLFPGHGQPNLPGDLGFYDLLLEESRIDQGDLARATKIDSFAYWHYWFGGTKILHEPLQRSLASERETFPFYFVWANETWQGRWYGANGSTLIEQTYPGVDDDEAHFRWVEDFFHSDRYVRFDGKPVFGIYKPFQIPHLAAFQEHWNGLAVKSGFAGIYWVGQLDKVDDHDRMAPYFDQMYLNPGALWQPLLGIDYRIFERLRLPRLIDASRYPDALRELLSRHPFLAPCVMPHWDNTPRSQRRGNVWIRNNPDVFERQLKVAFRAVQANDSLTSPRLIIVKSWNEWAESNCLEPGGWWGHAFLDRLRAQRLAFPVPT